MVGQIQLTAKTRATDIRSDKVGLLMLARSASRQPQEQENQQPSAEFYCLRHATILARRHQADAGDTQMKSPFFRLQRKGQGNQGNFRVANISRLFLTQRRKGAKTAKISLLASLRLCAFA